MSDPASDTPESLLNRAIDGDSDAARRIAHDFGPYLLSAAKRRARELPDDLHEEIVQEVWAAIYKEPRAPVGSTPGAAKLALISQLGQATDHVRSAYRDPGQTSRTRDGARRGKDDALKPAQVEPVVSLSSVAEDEQPWSEDRQIQTVELRFDFEVMKERASNSLRSALDLMMASDVSLSEAAQRTAGNRLRLQRELSALRQCLAA